MKTTSTQKTPDIQEMIDSENRKDAFIRRISISAWTVTLIAILSFGVVVAMRVAHTAELVGTGILTPDAIVEAMIPFVAVVGIVSLLVATLSTVGIFLRLRTASLSEIQMRLAALESVLLSDRPSS